MITSRPMKPETNHINHMLCDPFADQFESQSCTCQVLCDKTVYKPSLSYAELSDANIQNYVITDLHKKEEIQVKTTVSWV